MMISHTKKEILPALFFVALSPLFLAIPLSAQPVFPDDSAYHAVQCQGELAADPADVSGTRPHYDLRGDGSDAAVLWAADGTFLFLRLRLDGDPLLAPGDLVPGFWSWQLQKNQDTSSFEHRVSIDGNEPEAVTLHRNTSQNSADDPADPTEQVVVSYAAADDYWQVSAAGSSFGGDGDYFLTVAVAWVDLQTEGYQRYQTATLWAGSGATEAFASDMACLDNSSEPASLTAAASEPIALDPDLDSDGDGVGNAQDIDDDNDGLLDSQEGSGDSDGDGYPNRVDTDADGDGVTDCYEAGGVDLDGDGIHDGWVDANSNGADDSLETSPLPLPNTDAAQQADFLDADADGDGLTDLVEGFDPARLPLGIDVDGDGLDDAFDPDQGGVAANLPDLDIDGVPDLYDAINDRPDTDRDGVLDALDLDDDNDGILDGRERDGDGDGDGVPNRLDLDSDGDGVTDCYEAGGMDADGDGRIDGFTDTNGDGFDDRLVAAPLPMPNTDSSGGANFVDGDSDGDGLSDLSEGFSPDIAPLSRDWDRDGLDDAYDVELGGTRANVPDLDEDGIPDIYDPSDDRPDFDGDGVPDQDDADDDNDGIPDAVEGDADGDADGVPNYLDRDSDGDGVTDCFEAGGTDANGDGIIDGFTDVNRDGLDDATAASPLALPNRDGDGQSDLHDVDSDNDGLGDNQEAFAQPVPPLGSDSDGDGLDDAYDPDQGGTVADFPDLDGDGEPDLYDDIDDSVDSDGDGVSDPRDLDDDNDGVLDSIEGGGDFDGDGVPNRLDLDSDSDGVLDLVEGGGSDGDGDGQVDAFVDANSDGLDDALAAQPLPVPNHDGTGAADFLDVDSDDDTLIDLEEAFSTAVSVLSNDADGDGIDDAFDVDVGGVVADLPNLDNDSLADWIDSDDDGDTIGTKRELQDALVHGADPDQDQQPSWRDTESDGDTILDSHEGAGNVDSDNTPNYLDLESDGDGKLDQVEGEGDVDQDGVPNFLDPDDSDGPVSDPDGDGLVNSQEQTLGTDPYDADSDDDQLSDGVEVNTHATDPLDADSDDDGLEDGPEVNSHGTDPLDADCDDDLLLDGAEVNTHLSDPLDSDSDDDTLQDGAEVQQHLTSPIDADSDDDGLDDGAEVNTHGTDPLDADSDDDLLQDGAEISTHGTDPLDADSDNDGLDDGPEVLTHQSDPLDPDSDDDGLNDGTEVNQYRTDPTDPDTDDGGRIDGDEIYRGTDPLDPDDDYGADEADPDRDGIITRDDNCPLVANADQEDQDKDGLGDVCDADADGDGYPDNYYAYGGGCACDQGSKNPVLSMLAALLVLLGLGLRRRRVTLRPIRTRSSRGWSILSMLSIPLLAVALDAKEPADFSAERYHSAMDGEGIHEVEWAGLPEHLEYDLSLVAGYSLNSVMLYDKQTYKGLQRSGALVGNRFGASVVGSLALWEWVQLGMDLPVVLYQQRADLPSDVPDEGLAPFGSRDIRVVAKIRLLRSRDHFVDLALVPGFTVPTAYPKNQYLGEQFLTFVPKIALSKSFEGVRLAANLGYRWRQETRFANLSVGQQLTYGAGFAYDFQEKMALPLSAEASIGGETGVWPPFQAVNQSPMELVAGGGWTFAGQFQVFAAAGVGLVGGQSAPDFRALTGVRFAPRYSDRDKDGLEDRKDSCPGDPEDRDGFEDEDGCPERDNDNDGIEDQWDECPNVAGEIALAGCPVGDKDDDGVMDDEDLCPEVAGDAYLKGCKDTDGDGIPDNEDSCPDKVGEEVHFGCPDSDGDGIGDQDDACPESKGPPEYGGCPDEDGDGVIDEMDLCPQRPGPKESDGCADTDGDGFADNEDHCPEKPAPEGFNGCPDRDGDGFIDELDRCPDEPEIINGVRDDDGCPDKGKAKVVVTWDALQILGRVYFNSGRASIQSRSFDLLSQVASHLKANPQITKLRIEGHADSRASQTYNLKLSAKRARSVRRYLIMKGVDAKRLLARRYGETVPVASNETWQGRQKNRRVQFRILEINGRPLPKKGEGKKGKKQRGKPAKRGKPSSNPDTSAAMGAKKDSKKKTKTQTSTKQ